MPTMTITIVAGANTYTRQKTITGPHLTRWVAAKRVELNMTGSQTDSEVAVAWADKVFADERASVLTRERQAAQDTANAGVTPIDLT